MTPGELAIVVGTQIGGFITAYLLERAKNIAVQQDIEKITKQVESIKIDLELGGKVRQTVYDETKQAAIEAYKSFDAWFHEVQDAAKRIGFDNSAIYEEQEKRLKEKQDTFILNLSFLELYVGRGIVSDTFGDMQENLLFMEMVAHGYGSTVAMYQNDLNKLNSELAAATHRNDKIAIEEKKDVVIKKIHSSHREGLENKHVYEAKIYEDRAKLRDIIFKILKNEYVVEETCPSTSPL